MKPASKGKQNKEKMKKIAAVQKNHSVKLEICNDYYKYMLYKFQALQYKKDMDFSKWK
jgi:hypothetical protein